MMYGNWGGNALGWGNHFWGGGLMIVFALLFIGLVAFAVYWAAKRGWKGPSEGRKDDPLEILDARYARGEISTEEYRTMKSELKGNPVTK